MRRITLSLCLMIPALLALSGCSHHKELKSPCGQIASAADNPCNPLPLNIAHNDLHIYISYISADISAETERA